MPASNLLRFEIPYLVVAGLLIALWSCESKPQPDVATAPSVVVDSIATSRRNVAAVLGDYEGSMGGKYPFRLSITAQKPDSQLIGIYYYLSQHKPIELQGFVAPTGEIWLREFTPQLSAEEEETQRLRTWDEPATQPRQPFARFMVRRSPDGALAGTWQPANADRHLSVQLRRYRPSGPAQQAHVGEQTYFGEFRIPVFTAPDPGVTRRLWEVFGVEPLTDMSLAELRKVHLNHESGEAQGFDGVDSEVTYNQHGLLSVDLHSEYTGANVNHSYHTVVVDLHTGEQLTDEIDSARETQFLVACERKLQAQLATYIAEEYAQMATGTPNTDNDDLAGLRSQHISPQNQPDAFGIGKGVVVFHYPVQYEAMSNLMLKQFQNQFWLSFTFSELQPYLKPDSPLRRLVQR